MHLPLSRCAPSMREPSGHPKTHPLQNCIRPRIHPRLRVMGLRVMAHSLAMALGVVCVAWPLSPAWGAPRGGAPAPKAKSAKVAAKKKGAAKKKLVETLVSSGIKEFSGKDSLKMNWDPNNKGEIGDGTSDCFDTAMSLSVNGKNWSTSGEVKKTKPGGEMVVTGTSTAAPVEIRRRMLFDKKNALLRYIDTFTNTSRARHDLSIAYRSTLGSSAQNTVSNTGRVAMSGPLGKDETGIVAYRNRQSRPSVVFHLCALGAGNRPNLSVEGSHRYYNFLYNLKLPPGKSRSVCITIAQRHLDAQPSAEAATTLLKPLDVAATASLKLQPLVGPIDNLQAGKSFSGTVAIAEGALVELDSLLKARGLERVDNADTLILDDGQELGGEVTASPMAIRSRMGSITVPADDVAAIVGGRGEGFPTRLLLRNGEIFTGDIKPQGVLTIKTSSGLVIPVRVDSMELLVLRYKESDGARLAKDEVFLRLLDGSKCLAATNNDVNIKGIAPWGEFDARPADIVHMGHSLEPYPSYWVVDRLGSRFPAALTAGDAPFTPKRFAKAKLKIGDIAAVYRTVTDNGEDSATDDSNADDSNTADSDTKSTEAKSTEADGSKSPKAKTKFIELIGGARLAGTIELKSLKISNGKRARDIPVSIVHTFARDKKARESAGLAINWVSTSGEKSPGVLRTQVVPVKTAYGVWNVPATHIMSAAVNDRIPEKTVKEDAEGKSNGTGEKEAKKKDAPEETSAPPKSQAVPSKPKAPPPAPVAPPKKAPSPPKAP